MLVCCPGPDGWIRRSRQAGDLDSDDVQCGQDAEEAATISPSRFSSLAGFIGDQSLRPGPGQHELAKVAARFLERLDLPPGRRGRHIALLR